MSRYDKGPIPQIPPHWSDDPSFASEAQYNAFHAGEIPHPNKRDDDTVFIGNEDGVQVYVSRKNITGVDIAMKRDGMRREQAAKAERGLHEFFKGSPDIIGKLYDARYGVKS